MTKKYTVDFQKKGIVIADANGNRLASASYPKLENEIALPIQYSIAATDEKLIGTLSSYLPESKRVIMKNGELYSTLIIGGNEELILKTKGRKYDIGKVDLEDLTDEEAGRLKELDFSKGYRLRSAQESGKLDYFEKDGKVRATLTMDSSDFVEFIPIIFYDRIKKDLEGKTIKKIVPEKKPLKIQREEGEGAFVRWVKENFKPRMLEDAFNYQDQEGEKESFFEYLDHGIRPVILNGPTGNGKSVLARDFAFARGLPYYFDTGSSSFKTSTAVGKFVPAPNNPIFSPGSLTLAAIFGGVYVLEEMPPIPQDELTGLNIFLETMELPLLTHFGHEIVRAHPNFRFVATGNFHSNYTTNELNDAFLQRFTQLKIGYPEKDNTVDIIQARAPGLDYGTAELITDVLMKMRQEAKGFSKDLGLKGAVELAQRIQMGSDIPMKKLFEDNIVNPVTTYESSIDKRDGKLYTKLMKIVDEQVVGV